MFIIHVLQAAQKVSRSLFLLLEEYKILGGRLVRCAVWIGVYEGGKLTEVCVILLVLHEEYEQ